MQNDFKKVVMGDFGMTMINTGDQDQSPTKLGQDPV